MKTEDKVLIGLSAIGVSLTAILVANQMASKVPVFQAQPVPARPPTPAPSLPWRDPLLYTVQSWCGPDGPTHPTWNDRYRAANALVGGIQGAALGKSQQLAQPNPVSHRALRPMIIGGTQGYLGTASSPNGARGNPTPTPDETRAALF